MQSSDLITAPDRNPEDVRSESIDPDTLVIAWEVCIFYPSSYSDREKSKRLSHFFVCLFLSFFSFSALGA